MLPRPQDRTEKKEFPRHPAGSYQLVLADIIYLGHRIHEWQGKRKPQERIALVWQSLEIHPATHKRFELANEFTYSIFDRANLRAFLEGWFGAFANEAEAEDCLRNLDQAVGANVLGTIVHKKSADGTKTYVNVKAVAPLMKGMQNQQVVGYERPAFWTEKKAKYEAEYTAYLKEQADEEVAQEERFQDVPAALQDHGKADDLPF